MFFWICVYLLNLTSHYNLEKHSIHIMMVYKKDTSSGLKHIVPAQNAALREGEF